MIQMLWIGIILIIVSLVNCRTWKRLHNREYSVDPSDEVILYAQAKGACLELGGQLAILKKKDVYHFVKDNVIPSNISQLTGPPFYFWIGLERDENRTPKGFYWIDGTPVNQGNTFWATDNPSSEILSNFVRMGEYSTYNPSNVLWYNSASSVTAYEHHLSRYICERTVEEPWPKFGSSEYYFDIGDAEVTQSQAKDICEKKGSTLLLLKQPEVRELVVKNVVPASEEEFGGPAYAFWIGLERVNDTSGDFQWIDGSPIENGSEWWERGFPLEQADRKYVIMGSITEYDPNYRWRNIAQKAPKDEWNRNEYVKVMCEKKLPEDDIALNKDEDETAAETQSTLVTVLSLITTQCTPASLEESFCFSLSS